MFIRRFFVAFLLALPTVASAQLTIDTGVHSDVPTILQGLIDTLLAWSGLTATALFLIGCIIMVGSGGNEASLSLGKKIMKESLIGLAILLSSWLILSTVISFIAG